jgi:hypothetical protein
MSPKRGMHFRRTVGGCAFGCARTERGVMVRVRSAVKRVSFMMGNRWIVTVLIELLICVWDGDEEMMTNGSEAVYILDMFFVRFEVYTCQ